MSNPVLTRRAATFPMARATAANGATNDARTSPYLDPKRPGTRWLFDVERLPRRYEAFGAPGPHDAVLDAKAAAADLELVDDLLRATYAKYDDYARAGVDVAQLAAEHAARVASHTTITASDAFEPLMRDLKRAVPDRHMHLSLDGTFGRVDDHPSIAAYEYRGPAPKLGAAQAVAGAVAATAEVVPLVRADGTLDTTATIAAFGSDARRALDELGFAPVGAPVLDPDAPESGTTPTYTFTRTGDTGVIRLATLDDLEDERALDQFVADAPKHRDCNTLVIDLRGNPGGDTGIMERWLAAMSGPSSLMMTLAPVSFSSDAQLLAAQWNTAAVDARYGSESAKKLFQNDFSSRLKQSRQARILRKASWMSPRFS